MSLSQEQEFKGWVISGFPMLLLALLSPIALIYTLVMAINEENPMYIPVLVVGLILWIFLLIGFMLIEPNDARVLTFFGKYRGTFKKNGYYWINPLYGKNKLTLRARNLDVPPIKVNDRTGNPIMIGLVLVWRIRDTYKCMFDIDNSTMAANLQPGTALGAAARMNAYEEFVKIQSDAALRAVAGRYAYDNQEAGADSAEVTLRDGGEEVNEQLEQALGERLEIAGIEVVEARINYLAYAPEIAAVMLRRQQAAAIISAREKLVEGAVGMVDMALQQLEQRQIAQLNDAQKATLVSNLLVVLCAEEPAQPVVNASSGA